MKILEDNLLDGQDTKIFTDKLIINLCDTLSPDKRVEIEEEFVDDFILRYKNNPRLGYKVVKPFLPDSIRFPIGNFINVWGHKNDVCCHRGVFFLRTEVYLSRGSGENHLTYTIVLEPS